jgi:hypothetical protein
MLVGSLSVINGELCRQRALSTRAVMPLAPGMSMQALVHSGKTQTVREATGGTSASEAGPLRYNGLE